jgi:hypothetical protein
MVLCKIISSGWLLGGAKAPTWTLSSFPWRVCSDTAPHDGLLFGGGCL